MHEGHRKRLWEKLKGGDNLFEHEILEILLFNAYPRKNVNPIAHALLARFPSINEVLHADVDELCTVEGVGENVALYLRCIGKCLDLGNRCEGFSVIRNIAQFKDFVCARLKGNSTEVLEFYLMDKNGKVRRIFSFGDGDAGKVEVRPDEITKIISVNKPYGVYMAHNHVGCSSLPSPADDDITAKVMLICSLNNVRFYDHCIYSDVDGVFSYFLTDRLDEIKRRVDAAKMFGV